MSENKEQWKLDNEFMETLFSSDIIKQINEMEKLQVWKEKCFPHIPSFNLGYIRGLQWMLGQIMLKGRFKMKLTDEMLEDLKKIGIKGRLK